MTRLRVLAVLCGVACIVAAPSRARAQIPDKFENLQVLPKDIPRDTLIAIMRGFAGALGVRCTFCHVERDAGPAAAPAMPGAPAGAAPRAGGAPPGLNLDFASDAKDTKKTARVMLRMVDTVNRVFLARIPNRDVPNTSVTCVTCHRGNAKPTTIETVLLNTASTLGVDSAIARYRALRGDMASGKYNFGEQPVSEVARRLADQGRYDQAIALLQMNQEFYPNSVNIDFQLAETYLAKGDRDAGIARLRAVLAKHPNDRRAQQRLQQLGVQP
ncbi:MAG TPA: photosynthetic reaction center cytochrome c subunit family protein [Gemmatimonadaceae bacterium]|nr:photosynthetic reaction center cytochrome c subunit family protein [Gemmatimonadaceae bacterium]